MLLTKGQLLILISNEVVSIKRKSLYLGSFTEDVLIRFKTCLQLRTSKTTRTARKLVTVRGLLE